MGRNPLSGGRARRYVRVAQVAGVGLGVSAAALWALDVPGLKPMGELAVTAAPSGDAGAPVRANRPAPVDSPAVIAMADGLERARSARAAKAPPVEDGPGPSGDAEGWRYLGAVKEPGRLLALVSVGGKQRIVAAGRSIDDTEVVSITDDAIIVDDGRGERKIPRQRRQGPTVAWVTMPDAPTPGNIRAASVLEMSGLTNGDGEELTSEQIRRLEDRGIDSDVIARAKAARDAMSARRAARVKANAAESATPAAATGVPAPTATDSVDRDRDQRDRD